MKRSSNSFRSWLIAVAFVHLLATVILWPNSQPTKSTASRENSLPKAAVTAAVGEPVSSAPAPSGIQSREEDAIRKPLENEFQKRLLDSAVTLATAETQDPQQATRRIKSRLLRTPFKYPHIRSDETWDESPGGPRLVRRDLYVADHVMVRFPGKMSLADVVAWCGARGFVVRSRLKTDTVYLVATQTATLDSTIQLLETLRKSFSEDDLAAVSERDSLVFPTLTPNDPSYGQLYGLHNTGQSPGTPDADIDAPEAWEFSTGSADVVVAVIDTGVDHNHTDLRDNIWTNTAEIAGNSIDDDGNGFIDDRQGWDFYADDNEALDENGHGSHCSGTIGGTGNNGIGVVGVSWDVSIVPVRFLGPFGGSTSDGIEAINYSTAIGVDLSSNSWGGGGFSSLLEQAITRANTAGILFVAAAGNDAVNNDSSPHYPSNYSAPNIISVASTTANDVLSSFSNFGLTSVDLAAPGSDIYSTLPNNLYGTKSGTSMATPHVSGALALLRSMAPGLDHLQLKQHLLTNVDLIPAMTSKCTTGGRLNVAKAAALLAGPRVIPTTARVAITSGNGDPYLNPGEQGEFVFVFRNVGSVNAINVSAALSPNTTYPGITLTNPLLTVGNLTSAANSAEFRIPFTVDAAVATPTLAEFTLTITDSAANTWLTQQTLSVSTSTTVTGRVTSVADGSPITTALVTWTGPVSDSINVDALGNFSFIAIDGSYTVSASAPGFVSVSQISVSTPPSPTPLDLRLGVPDLTVSPLFVQQSIFAGSTSSTILTLQNQGNAPLTWTAVSKVGSSTVSLPADQQPTNAPSLIGKSIGNIGATSAILSDFTARGATLVPITLPLATDELDGIDVLIIEDSISSATPDDIALMRTWVSQGGGLFLTADNVSSMGNVNALLQSSGIQETSLNTFISATISSIFPHPTTADVTSLTLSSYGSSCTLTTPAVPLMQDSTGRTIGGATTLNSGRIIALGNEIDSSISGAGGRLFANQAVDWLSKTVRWLSVADGAGVLAPGESHSLTVQFDSTRLNAGGLSGEIIILSNEPGNPRTVVPVSLTVIGSPAIAANPTSLAFPTTFVNGAITLNLRLENPGTDTLTVSSLAFNNPAYTTTTATPLSILPRGNAEIPVRFSPLAAGPHPATLSIGSNSPSSPTLTVDFSGSGVNGPNLSLSPESFTLTLPLGSRLLQPLNIANIGDYPLDWSLDLATQLPATTEQDALQKLLTKLDANFTAITSLIPNRFDFTDGVTGTNISDGGSDMYDSGNYLATNLSATYISYSDGKIIANPTSLGPKGRYFTRKHPGLFVFAAELDGVSGFNISGGLGADGSGFANGVILRHTTGGKNHVGYVKRVHGAGKPSVNHLIIVEDRPGISRTFSTNTNDDIHAVSGLSGSRQLYHLVFASSNGGLVDDATCAAIMQAFLKNVTPSLPWLGFDSVAGSVTPSSQQTPSLIFDTTTVDPGQYAATVKLTTNDPAKSSVSIPVSLTVTSAPVIQALPNPVNFASVPIDSASQQSVEIRNAGNLPLILSAASVAGDPAFSVAPLDNSILAPGATTVLQLLYSPTSTGPQNATLNLTSNSPISPVLAIPLNGTAVAAGILQAIPTSLAFTVESGQTGTLPLTLRNTGNPTLSWTSSPWGAKATSTSDLRGLSVALVSSSPSGVTNAQASLTTFGAATQFLNYSALTRAALNSFDVAVFDSNIENLDSTQIAAVSSWLANGGAVLVHSSSSASADQNTLFAPFGISLAAFSSTAAWTPVGTHILTKGITSVTHDPSYNRITSTAPAVALLREPSANITAAISQANQGRVAVLTGAITSFTGNNSLFFSRMVGWLGNHVNWLSQSPNFGSVAALGTTATQVTFDARNLFAGTYTANLMVDSISLTNPLLVPVRMTVTGTPDIAIPSPLLQFAQTYVGYAKQSSFSIANDGTAPLLIQAISVPHPDLTVITGLPTVIAPRQSLAIITEFRPTSSHQLSGNIEITSNDPDTPVITLPVTGNSIVPPVIVAPASFQMTAVSGQTATKLINIGNTGGSDLSWSLEYNSSAVDTPLDATLPLLDQSAAAISELIPGKYSFSDGVTGTSISDGGNDMYDSGNILSTNLSTSATLPYSDGIVASNSAILGTGGRYFTRKYDGLFVLAADIEGVSTFKISGGLGADGSGFVDGSSLAVTHRGIAWRGLVKRVYGAPGTPSVDHLIIVRDQPGLAQTFSSSTDSDIHDITGLSSTNRLYYLLYSNSTGGYIGDAETTAIMRRFLDSIGEKTPWMTANPSVGTTPATGSSEILIQADARRLYAGTYQTTLIASHDDPARPTLFIPSTLTVTGTPRILVDSPYFTFPSTIVGASKTLDLTVHNSGTDVLSISEVRLTSLFSTTQTFPLQVPPGETAAIPVTYSPSMLGLESGIATIVSNAANTPSAFVFIYGIGVPPPRATVDPAAIQVSMGAASSREESRPITNSGLTNLLWTAGIDYGQANPLANQLDFSGLTVRVISESSSGKFATLITELNRLGANAAEIYYTTFNSAILANTDLLLIDGSLNSVPNADLQAIKNWVSAGGGLMATDPGSSTSDFNTLTLGSGLAVESMNSGLLTTLTDIRYDITTVGVTSLVSGGYVYTKILTTGTARPLAALSSSQIYAAIGSLGSGRIVGATGDLAANTYITSAGNLRFVTNSLAWLSGRVRNWVEPVPTSGVTGVNASSSLSFIFDTTGLIPGTYFADAVVKTNDPARAEIRIPLSLQVTNSAQISASVSTMDLGATIVGASSERSIVLKNIGHNPLTISSATVTAGFSIAATFPIILDLGKSATIKVTFAPPAVGPQSGSLVVNSNALTDPQLTIPLSGFGLAAPTLVVPSQVNLAIVTNTSQIRTLPIGNTGSGHLTWRIADSFVAGKPLTYPPSLTGVKAGFLTSTSSYSAVRTKLTSYGCSIVNVAAPVQQATLNAINVLVVDDTFSSTLVAADYSRIRAWVEAGGSLMLTAENLTVLQPLLSGTGINPVSQYRSAAPATTSSLHPVTTGVSSAIVYFSEAWFTLSGDAVPLLSFDATSIYAAAVKRSRGHIIAIGNEAFEEDNFASGDGERFAVQCLTWLSNRLPWLVVSQNAGNVPPGGSDAATLAFNSSNLALGTHLGTLLLESNDPTKTSVQLPLSLTVTANTNAASFAQWQYDYVTGPTGPNSGFSDDWNGDGLANGLEFYFAIDPANPHNRHHLPTIALDDGAFIYRYTRLSSMPDNLLRIRHSTDLSAWTALSAAALGEITTHRTNGDGTTTVEHRFPNPGERGFFSFILDSP